MNGVISMVLLLSFGSSSTLDAISAGTVQPKPRIIGMNARPESPSFPMMLFMTYATRDI